MGWIRHLIRIFRQKKKADQNCKLQAASRTEANKYIGKKSPLYSMICSRISLYTPITTNTNFRLQKKNTSIFTKMESRLTRWLAGEDRSHHIQAAHPGNKWHKRSESIASCISCWTYKGKFRLILHQIYRNTIRQRFHPVCLNPGHPGKIEKRKKPE